MIVDCPDLALLVQSFPAFQASVLHIVSIYKNNNWIRWTQPAWEYSPEKFKSMAQARKSL